MSATCNLPQLYALLTPNCKPLPTAGCDVCRRSCTAVAYVALGEASLSFLPVFSCVLGSSLVHSDGAIMTAQSQPSLHELYSYIRGTWPAAHDVVRRKQVCSDKRVIRKDGSSRFKSRGDGGTYARMCRTANQASLFLVAVYCVYKW